MVSRCGDHLLRFVQSLEVKHEILVPPLELSKFYNQMPYGQLIFLDTVVL